MQPVVGIVMGSSSDHEVMAEAATILERFGVALRDPRRLGAPHARGHDRLRPAARASADSRSSSPAPAAPPTCPGMLAAVTTLPVIGVPVALARLDGLDSLLSIVQMPRGVPVATVAINGATNAGLLAARILVARRRRHSATRLEAYREELGEPGRRARTANCHGVNGLLTNRASDFVRGASSTCP